MPIYEYNCSKCGKRHEVMQKITDQSLTVCPDCGGELRKIISNTSFVLKGTGWYVTDYASNRQTEKKSDAVAAKDSPKEEKKAETPAAPKEAAAKI